MVPPDGARQLPKPPPPFGSFPPILRAGLLDPPPLDPENREPNDEPLLRCDDGDEGLLLNDEPLLLLLDDEKPPLLLDDDEPPPLEDLPAMDGRGERGGGGR